MNYLETQAVVQTLFSCALLLFPRYEVTGTSVDIDWLTRINQSSLFGDIVKAVDLLVHPLIYARWPRSLPTSIF